MKNKIKYTVVFFIILGFGIISINLFNPQKEQQIKGHIEILATDKSYDFLTLCADKFMETNPKTTVTITKMNNYSELEELMDNTLKNKLSNVGEANRLTLENIGMDKLKPYENANTLLDTYEKNFAKYRIEQVEYNGNAIGIPLTSRPLVLYLREDMLKQYNYDRADFNTWDDVIRIGKDIYEKSGGTVRILNATDQDYKDLVDLLIMENMTNDLTEDEIIEKVNSKMDELKNNNIINLTNGGEFLARISSINAMKEIAAIEEKCQWSVGTVPSLHAGTNKFYSADGSNIIVLSENADNQKLIDKFITYVMTNTKDGIEFVKNGDFFSSYLYTYKSTEIEKHMNNFYGASPLVVMSNVEEKTLPIGNYNKYIKIKQKLIIE